MRKVLPSTTVLDCTSHFTLDSAHLALHTTHYTTHFTLHTSHPTLVSHCTLHISHLPQHTPHITPFALHTPHFSLHTPHSTHQTIYTLHTQHFTLHTSLQTFTHSALSTPHFTLHTSSCTLAPNTPHSTFQVTSHFTRHTLHFTLHTSHFHTPHLTLHTPLHTSHFTLSTPHSILHTPLFTIHTSHFTMQFHTSLHIAFSHFPHRHHNDAIRHPQSNLRLSTTKSHTCHAKCTFTRRNTSPFLTFPIDSATTRLDQKKKTSKQLTILRPPRKKQEPFATQSVINISCICFQPPVPSSKIRSQALAQYSDMKGFSRPYSTNRICRIMAIHPARR